MSGETRVVSSAKDAYQHLRSVNLKGR